MSGFSAPIIWILSNLSVFDFLRSSAEVPLATIFPLLMISTRSQVASISARM